MEPNVVDLRYFKLWILLNQIIRIWNIKGLQQRVLKILGFKYLILLQRLNSFAGKIDIFHVFNNKFSYSRAIFYIIGYTLLEFLMSIYTFTTAQKPRFAWILSFFFYKSRPSLLKTLKPSKEYSRGSTELTNQSLRQIGPRVSEWWSNRQTEITTLFIFIDNQSCSPIAPPPSTYAPGFDNV